MDEDGKIIVNFKWKTYRDDRLFRLQKIFSIKEMERVDPSGRVV